MNTNLDEQADPWFRVCLFLSVGVLRAYWSAPRWGWMALGQRRYIWFCILRDTIHSPQVEYPTCARYVSIPEQFQPNGAAMDDGQQRGNLAATRQQDRIHCMFVSVTFRGASPTAWVGSSNHSHG